MVDDPLRRRVLLATGATVGVTLAGCTGDETEGGPAPGDDGTSGTDGTGEGTFADAITVADSYAFTGELDDGDITGRYHEGDQYMLWEMDGQETEFYLVDGDSYIVGNGDCMLNRGEEPDEDEVDVGDLEDEAAEHPDLEPTETTTIDGEEVDVYEVDGDDGEDLTYYVSTDTGYVRRMTGEFGRIDFDSWGAADPVDPPDMECQEAPDGY